MPHLIFADDLTGANATGAALRGAGASVATGLHLVESASADFFLLNTSTRERTDAAAYRVIREHMVLARSLGGFPIFGRRVDSTLRGPISGEIEALLSALPDAVIAFVPAFPGSGRTMVDGRLLVYGVPVDETELRGVHPDLPERLRQETSYSVCHVPLDAVRGGVEEVVRVLREHEARIYVFDGTEDRDVRIAADAVARMDWHVIAFDPGLFTVAWARAKGWIPAAPRIFCAIGSRTTLAQGHVEELNAYGGCLLPLRMDAVGGSASARRQREIAQALARSDAPFVGLYVSQDWEGTPQTVLQILATLVLEHLRHVSYDGLYLTGGDTALAIYRALEAQCMEIVAELYPLVAAGRLIGGMCDGWPVLTKGGFVRPPDSAVELLTAFGRHIRRPKATEITEITEG